MILPDERFLIPYLEEKYSTQIDYATGCFKDKEDTHWSEIFTQYAADVEVRSTTRWPVMLSFYEYKDFVDVFSLLYQDGELLIQPTRTGLHLILDMLYDDTERSPAGLDMLFRDFLKTEEWHCISDDEKARLKIIGRSPVLKVRHKYWLYAGEGILSPLQVLSRDWYLAGQCVHVDVDNPIYQS